MSATDLRVPLAPAFDIFGVAATVTPAGGSPLAATVVWVTGRPSPDSVGYLSPSPVVGFEAHARLAIRRSDVPSLGPGGTISAPAIGGGTPQTWVVDRIESLDPELWVAVVH